MRVYEVMSKAVETVKPKVAASELLARKPEHKSNREVRKAGGQEEWAVTLMA